MERGGVVRGVGMAVYRSEARQEMRRKFRNVGAAVAQRWDDDGKHVETEEKIFAETSGGDGLG